MLGRLLFREIHCFHTSSIFYNEINYLFWLKTYVLTGKMGNSLSLASLARNLEFCLSSRKTSKMQEIAHYSHDCGSLFGSDPANAIKSSEVKTRQDMTRDNSQ